MDRTRDKRISRRCRTLAAFLALSVLFASGSIAALSVTTQLSSQSTYIGDPVILNVSVENSDLAEPPSVPSSPGKFTSRYLGATQQSSSSFQIVINGRQVQNESKTTVTYRYEITPLVAGTHTIPQPMVTIDGDAMPLGNSQRFSAKDADRTDRVIVELSVDKTMVGRYQAFTATVTLFLKPIDGRDDIDPWKIYQHFVDVFRRPQIDPPSVLAPWIADESVFIGAGDDEQWMKETGFIQTPTTPSISVPGSLVETLGGTRFHADLSAQRVDRKTSDGKTVRYFRYAFQRKMFVRSPGTYTLLPVTFKGNFVKTIDERGRADIDTLFVRSNEVVITVQDTPALAGFDGVYGAYEIKATARPTTLNAFDPMTLEVTLRQLSVGEIDRVVAPDLGELNASNFRLLDDKPSVSDDKPSQSRTFTWRMRPLSHKVERIEPIAFTYMDINTGNLRTIATDPIPLDVRKTDGSISTATAPNVAETPGSSNPASSASARSSGGIALVDGDIFHLDAETDAPLVRALSPVASVQFAVSLAGVYLLLFAAVRFYRLVFANERFQKRLRAKSRAQARLDAAFKRTDGAAAEIIGAYAGLIADLAGVSEAGLTPRRCMDIIRSATKDSALLSEIQTLFDALEKAGYGGGDSPIEPDAVRRILDRLASLPFPIASGTA